MTDRSTSRVAVFHLAIPTHDLDACEAFYTRIIGAIAARRYDDRVTYQFFGHQLVCHLAPEKVEARPSMYPRHFGMTFVDRPDFDAIYERCRDLGDSLYKDRFIRWSDRPEAHETFFVADPSNNLIEFKYYYDPAYIY